VIVRNVPGIQIGNIINAFEENGDQIYELDDLVLVKPVVNFSNNAPAVNQIGATVALVTFNGSIVAGTYPITSRSITPDPGGLDLTAPFSFQKANVKRTTPGTAELHTVQATDNQGYITSKQSGVVFKHAFYQGFLENAILNQAQIKALINKTLNDTILDQYAGKKTYVVPSSLGTSKYIYWCGVVGTTAISAASLGGLALPLLDLAPVNVTNEFDGSVVNSYWVKRTANLLDPGSYDITIS